MTKSYKGVRLKKNRVYSRQELMTEYSVEANTVSDWDYEGMGRSDDQKPYLYRGQLVQEFHRNKRHARQFTLLPGQFYCRRCQKPVFPVFQSIEGFLAKNGRHMYSAKCQVCATTLNKISSEADRDLIEDCRNPDTPTQWLHERNTSGHGDIGTSAVNVLPLVHCLNDRIIHKWQTYAGRYNDKTVDRHLAAIRFFETTLDGKPFATLSTDDFALVRDEIKRRAVSQAKDRMSASMIRHTISHIVAFFDWLICQDGYRRLPRDFAGYLKVPKSVVAQSAQVRQKEFPDLVEAEDLLNAMRTKSVVDRRSRGIFALAFLGALRADTLASLRIGHIDIEKRLIVQDASAVRAKNGKNMLIRWFSIPVAFEIAVIEWINFLKGLGFVGEDALFPDTKYLKHRFGASLRNAAPVPVMSTTHAVTSAFSAACQNCEAKYTPHAAKHTIGAERDIRSLTQEERKAWSLNMGHESEQTTDQHYGSMPEDRRFEVLEGIGTKKTIDPRGLSDSQKAKILDEILVAIGSEG